MLSLYSFSPCVPVFSLPLTLILDLLLFLFSPFFASAYKSPSHSLGHFYRISTPFPSTIRASALFIKRFLPFAPRGILVKYPSRQVTRLYCLPCRKHASERVLRYLRRDAGVGLQHSRNWSSAWWVQHTDSWLTNTVPANRRLTIYAQYKCTY